MNTANVEQTIRRILVAVDASSHSTAALEAAAELAAGLRAELVGLFVEDINLLHSAGLPFTRQVDPISAALRPFESQHIERQLKVQANRARQILESTATLAKVQWSFRVARGRVGPEVLGAASEADLVVLGRAGWSPGRRGRVGSTARAMISKAPCLTLLLQHGTSLKLPVRVLHDGSEGANRSLASAAQLPQAKDGGLTVLIVRDSDKAAERTQSEISEWAKTQGLRVGFRRLAAADTRSVLEAVRSEGEGVLVLPAGSPVLDEGGLQMMMTQIACPILVVR